VLGRKAGAGPDPPSSTPPAAPPMTQEEFVRSVLAGGDAMIA